MRERVSDSCWMFFSSIVSFLSVSREPMKPLAQSSLAHPMGGGVFQTSRSLPVSFPHLSLHRNINCLAPAARLRFPLSPPSLSLTFLNALDTTQPYPPSKHTSSSISPPPCFSTLLDAFLWSHGSATCLGLYGFSLRHVYLSAPSLLIGERSRRV